MNELEQIRREVQALADVVQKLAALPKLVPEFSSTVLPLICWRCKREEQPGRPLVRLQRNADDTPTARDIYHYYCIPPVRWREFAGSLPAWEGPSNESPVAHTGTSLAAPPTSRAHAHVWFRCFRGTTTAVPGGMIVSDCKCGARKTERIGFDGGVEIAEPAGDAAGSMAHVLIDASMIDVSKYITQ